MDLSDLREIAAGSDSRVELWSRVLQVSRARTVLEVGVWKGHFAKQILERCSFIERYYMVDPWASLPDWNKPFNVAQENFDAIYSEAMENTAFASEKRVVLRGRTKEVIDDIPDDSVDFSYIDGDHTLRGITIDLIRVLPKVRAGGLIAGDDFSIDPWQHGARFEPTLVCPFSVYFAEAMGYPIAGLPHDQFLIQKDSGSGFSFVDVAGAYGNLALNENAGAIGGRGLRAALRRILGRAGFTR